MSIMLFTRRKIKTIWWLNCFASIPRSCLSKWGKGFAQRCSSQQHSHHYRIIKIFLAGMRRDYSLSIPSPFSIEQVDVFIKPLSTRFKDREQTKGAIVTMIKSLFKKPARKFSDIFPVLSLFTFRLWAIQAIRWRNANNHSIDWDDRSRRSIFGGVYAWSKWNLTWICCSWRDFSEGVDLIGDRLNGVVVVGVGLPQLCFERNLIKDHFYKKDKNGYDYAYVYPGMNKVLQAGGRLIRSETDHGTIVLIDDRFLQKQYQMLLPPEWREYKII